MSLRKNLCVLAAETVVIHTSADAKAEGREIQYAIDRCVRRGEVATEANKGTIIQRHASGFCAGFERCDAAVLTACEILIRVQNLPPLGGLRLEFRIGIHYGLVDDVDTMMSDTLLGDTLLLRSGEHPVEDNSGAAPLSDGQLSGEGIDIATTLMKFSRNDEALASSAAVMLLSASTRHFARAVTIDVPELQALEWSLYAIAKQPQTTVTLPPATKLVQRLRIRHQESLLFVDEQHPVLMMGRELGNDVVIMDPRASRQHARIERRREGFVLIDHSSNGCFILEEGARERHIKNREISLIGPGRIGCGCSASDLDRDLVFFEII